MLSPRVHFIGIGGIGMSALARWYRAHGWAVSGSDAERSLITRALRREGIRIAPLPQNAALAVRSQAIPPAHQDLRAARKLGIPVLPYPKLLGRIADSPATAVAVAGAHGKSTTTALISLMLIAAKKNPTVIIGTLLKEFGGRNFRAGSDNLLVFEADEYGHAFLNYSPTVAVVTNIDREHLDVYPSLRDAQKAFLQFLSRVKPGGTLVLNRDDRNLKSLNYPITQIARKHKLRVFWYSIKDPIARDVRRVIRIPGKHNVSNAVGAITAAQSLGAPKKIALHALARYRGAWRRMEHRGKAKLIMAHGYWLMANVFDDYAHHPTEIKATLAAFREKFPRSPLVCVFQPHQALRLEKLFKEFTIAFDGADALVLLPLYRVAGRDKVNPRFTSQTLARAIQKKYPKKPVIYASNQNNLRSVILSLLNSLFLIHNSRRTATLVMMGAGDIVQYTEKLIAHNQ